MKTVALTCLLLLATSSPAAEIDKELVDALQSKSTGVRILAITNPKWPKAAVKSALPAKGFQTYREFSRLNLIAGTATREAVDAMAKSDAFIRIGLDPEGYGNLAQSEPLAGVTPLEMGGLNGTGLTVAVIDSGIDTDHPEFNGRIVGEQCFCQGCCPGGGNTQSGAGSAEDDHGHGTNVSGISVGNSGVADNASIVAVKVLNASNGFCCASDPIAALDWIIANRPDVDVVNMSLGTFATFAGNCDAAATFTLGFASAINTLRTNGVAVVVSTGNQGMDGVMEAPACIANAISVGAVWDSSFGSTTFLGCTENATVDNVTCFSNTSTTTDLFAPGAFVQAAGLGGGTSNFGGTSQASPIVAGCIALLKQAEPTASLADIEAALKSTGTTVTDPSSNVSYPRINCDQALASLAIFSDGFETP